MRGYGLPSLFVISMLTWIFCLTVPDSVATALPQSINVFGRRGEISLVESIILFVLGMLFVAKSLFIRERRSGGNAHASQTEEISSTRRLLLPGIGAALLLSGGGVLLTLGTMQAVPAGFDLVFGLVPLAVITSFPEFSVTWVAHSLSCRDRDSGADQEAIAKDRLALGNIVESNIFNLLFIFGLFTFLANIALPSHSFEVPDGIDTGVMLVALIFVTPLLNSGRGLSRKEGAYAIVIYFVYAAYEILLRTPDVGLFYTVSEYYPIFSLILLVAIPVFSSLFIQAISDTIRARDTDEQGPAGKLFLAILGMLIVGIVTLFAVRVYSDLTAYVRRFPESPIADLISLAPIDEVVIFLVIFVAALVRTRVRQ